MRHLLASRRCGVAGILLMLVVVVGCLPPTRTGKTCESHADCAFVGFWGSFEEALAPDFRCDRDEGICVPGIPPADAGIAPDDDAGVPGDAGPVDAGEDAGAGDAGVTDAGAADAGVDGGDPGNPPLPVNVGTCLNSIVDTTTPITGLVVARRSGPSVTMRLDDLGLLGLFPLCVGALQELGTFSILGSNITFTPGEEAFAGEIFFSSTTGGAARRVLVVIFDVEAAGVRLWSPSALTDDVDDPANWVPLGLPGPTDVVYVPQGDVPPTFGAVSAYARTLFVEPSVDVRLTAGLGLGAGALVAGRASTLTSGKVVVHGGVLAPTEHAPLAGRVSSVEIRDTGRATVVAPLDVERALTVTSALVEGARPELVLERPVRMRVGGDLILGNSTVFADYGRMAMLQNEAVVEVFGNVVMRTAAATPSNLYAGALRAWSGFTCREGAADFNPDFRVSFPGDEGTVIETDYVSACHLGVVHVEEFRIVHVVPLLGAPATATRSLRTEGTILVETRLDVDACCLGPRGIIASIAGDDVDGAVYVDDMPLVPAGSCVSFDVTATLPGTETACSLPDTGLCTTTEACPF